MKKPKRKPQRAQRSPNELTDKHLASVVGGRLDNAPINVVSDYNPDAGG